MLSKINTKTIARIAGVQALYQAQDFFDNKISIIDGSSKVIEDIISNLIKFYESPDSREDLNISKINPIKIKLNTSYFTELVKTTISNISEINDIIKEYLTANWTMINLPITLKSLLQVAVCELKFFPETPYKVVINEYTDIASDMIGEHEISFVNSLLDKLAKNLFR